MLVRMTRIIKSYIMRIALERSVVHDLEATSHIPSLKTVVRKLERAVLYKLRIKSSVSGKVDILNEDSVHGRLDFSARLVDTDLHLVCLCHNRYGCSHRQ